jgi:hypothetical protein
VDINRQLVTVKDESELDSLDLQAAELGAQVRAHVLAAAEWHSMGLQRQVLNYLQ